MKETLNLVVQDMERSIEISKDVYEKHLPSWEDFNELRNTMMQCKEVLQGALKEVGWEESK